MMTVPSTLEHDEACHWLARMDAGNWSAEDQRLLQEWLRADRRREGMLLRLQAEWCALDTLEPAEPRRLVRFWHRRGFLAGCSGAIAASLAGMLWLSSPQEYETQLGEIRRVALDDGSVVAINTSSRVKIDMKQSRREVVLAAGEAWFQVAKSRERPFLVTAGTVRVLAVGTAFSVRRMDHGAEILVTEGIVEVWSSRGGRIAIREGERAFVSANASARKQMAMAASNDRALAWRAGRIELLGEPLASAVAEFNRYNRRKLVLRDPELGKEQLDGVFRIDDVEGFAHTIGRILDVEIDSTADAIQIG